MTRVCGRKRGSTNCFLRLFASADTEHEIRWEEHVRYRTVVNVRIGNPRKNPIKSEFRVIEDQLSLPTRGVLWEITDQGEEATAGRSLSQFTWYSHTSLEITCVKLYKQRRGERDRWACRNSLPGRTCGGLKAWVWNNTQTASAIKESQQWGREQPSIRKLEGNRPNAIRGKTSSEANVAFIKLTAEGSVCQCNSNSSDTFN